MQLLPPSPWSNELEPMVPLAMAIEWNHSRVAFLFCAANYDLGATPTTKEAQAIADELYADFVSEEVDKVEMIYTKFVSLISSDPVVQTLLPLTPQVSPPPFHFELLCMNPFRHTVTRTAASQHIWRTRAESHS